MLKSKKTILGAILCFVMMLCLSVGVMFAMPTTAFAGTSSPDYFSVTNTGTGDATLQWKKWGSPTMPKLWYSTDDGGTFTEVSIGSTNIPLANGKTVYFKGDYSGASFSGTNDYIYLTCTGENATLKLGGDLTTLLDGKGNVSSLAGYSKLLFSSLFKDLKALTDASTLKLPSTTLNNQCYRRMFFSCSALKNAPALPATTLADSCYDAMFCRCSSLTDAPALPATTLAENCYYSMFEGCTKLQNAPALPAKELKKYCYDSMFEDCEALKNAPALMAPLSNYSCGDMFEGCSSLDSLTVGFHAFDPKIDHPTSNWLSSVSETGTVYVPADFDMSYTPGESTFPATWTVVKTYAISDGTADLNGIIEIDKATAAEGETVTVTVTPNEGYQLKSLTVAAATVMARPITPTPDEQDKTKYTFTMPAHDVKVIAEFEAAVTTATFDFTTNLYGHKGVSSGGGAEEYVSDGDIAVDEKFTEEPTKIEFTAKGSSQTKFWDASNKHELRLYRGATFVLSVVGYYKITKVEFTGSAVNLEANGETVSDKVWEGNATKLITFVNTTTGSKINSIKVTYIAVDPWAEIPTITPDTVASVYWKPITVTLACETEGATIHYTLDGSDPTKESAVYSEPISISATTTVKAVAVKEGLDNSEVVSKTFTFGTKFASLEELIEKQPAKDDVVYVEVTITDAVIDDFYVSSKGYTNGVYVTAAGTTVEIYCNDVPETWEVGGKVSGTIKAEWLLYKDTAELQKWEGGWDAFTYTAPAPTYTIADIIATNPDFPTSNADAPVNAWVSDNGHTLYTNGICLYSDTIDNEVVGLKEIVIKNGDSYYYTNAGATITLNMVEGVLTSIDLSNVHDYTGNYAPALVVTVADILPADFPTSDDGNAPLDAWVNSNNEKMFSCEGDCYIGGESDGDFVLSVDTELTKDGKNYKCTKDGATVTFVMEGDALVSIIIEGLVDFDKLNGTYKALVVNVAQIDCPTCHGDGLAQCSECFGMGCDSCDRTGKVPCTNCGQTGKTLFTTLEDAISEVKYYGKITLLKDNSEEIEISQATVFIIDKATFTFDKSKITAGTGYEISTSENGTETTFIVTTQKTIAEILATLEGNFPTTEEDAWVNEYLLKAYLDNTTLYIGSVNLAVNTSLTKSETNYVYSCFMYDVKFVMTQGKLTSIEVSRVLSGTANGIFKAVIGIEKPVADETNFVYNGEEQTYTIEASDFYTINNNVQTSAGNYTVTVSLKDKVNYKWVAGDSEDLTFTFVINKAQAVINTDGVVKTYVYTGEEQKVESGATLNHSETTLTYSNNAFTTANTYTVTISAKETANYLGASENVIVTVNKATGIIYVDQTQITRTYGEAVTLPEATSNFGKVTCDTLATDLVNANTYTVTYTLEGTENYTGDTKELTVVIDKAILTVTIDDKSSVYGEELVELTATCDNLKYEDKASDLFRLGTDATKSSDVGAYLIWAEENNGVINYEIEFIGTYIQDEINTGCSTYTITKKDVSKPELDTTNFIYTGSPLTYTVANSDLYSVSGNVETNVGNYDVIITLVDPENYKWTNGDSEALTYDFTIAKATGIIYVDQTQITKTYGEAVTLPEATSNFGDVTCDKTSEDLVNANTYIVTYTLDGTENYTGDVKTLTVVINKAQAVINTEGVVKTYIYTGEEQKVESGATLNHSETTLTYSNNAFTTVNSYTVTISAKETANYLGASENVIVTVNKATGIIYVDQTQITNTYGEAVVLPEATSNFGDVTCDKTSEDLVNANTYIVTYTLDGTDNYTGDVKQLTVVINKAEVTKPNEDTTNYIYTGAAITYSVAENELYEVTGNVQTEVGNYTVTVSLKDKVNYKWVDGDSTDLEFTFIIKQAKIINPVDEDDKEIEEPSVMIIDSEKGLDPNAIFVVKVISSENVEDTENVEDVLNENSAIGNNEKIYGIYDAKLLVDGVEKQPDGNITIKLLVPEEIRNKSFKLYHIHNGSEVIEVEYTEVDSDGFITFVTDKLSQFAFVAEKPAAKLSVGAIVGIVIGALIVLLVILYFVMYFIWKKTGKANKFLIPSYEKLSGKFKN